MKSKHDKLIVSNPIYMEKINSKKIKILCDIRVEILESVNEQLKKDNAFQNMPFLWLGIIEYYGDYSEIGVEFKKISKKDGDLDMRIFIPFSHLDNLDFENPESLVQFHRNIYKIAIDEVFNKYASK